ncbi:MAG: hypothetical protein AcusKO_14610 [Acuticoccus sp.]
MEFANLIGPVAERLLGTPNKAVSTRDELRFGTRGSLSVKVGGPHKGTWRSHEDAVGGGVLDLIAHQRSCDRLGAMEWLKAEFPDIAGLPERPQGGKSIVATYPYFDEEGQLLFEVVRFSPKDFRQRRPDGRGGYFWNLKGVSPVPYHLTELIEAVASGRTIFVAEGEKAVDRLRDLGVTATCSPGGAGKWREEFAAYFDDAHVVILPDADEAGEAHGEMVARSLSGAARLVRVVNLPGLRRKEDPADWIAAGGTFEALQEIVDQAPAWRRKRVTKLPAVWYGDEDATPPLSWLVKGVFVDGGLSAVFGGPGTSKTFLVLDMALHVAHGREWMGRRVDAAGVVYVTGEGGAGLRLRMKAWRKENDGAARAPFVMIPTSVNLYDDEKGADTLISDIAEHAESMGMRCRLVVLDTLSRMIGSGDEDKARDINVVVQRAERIQRETGAHVLIVHHSGKDRDRGMRGSNALLGAVDAAVEVSRFDTGLCEGTIVKVKDGADLEPFKYTLMQSVLGTDGDGEDITSCVVTPVDASYGGNEGQRSRLTDPERIAFDALREAVAEAGTAGQGGHVPVSVRCVPVSLWREYAYKRGVSTSEEAEAKKKAFQRVRQRLQRKGFVGIWGDDAWLARSEG